MKTIRFVKIRCHTCGYITLIPTFGEFRVTEPVYCEDCGKLILEKIPLTRATDTDRDSD